MTNEITNSQSSQSDLFLAQAMSTSKLLPPHLRFRMEGKGKDKVAVAIDEADVARTCFVLVKAAQRFGMEPMALAQASYEVHGKVDYEGRVYAALANRFAGLKAPLNVEYLYGMGEDKPPTFATVFGTFQCEVEPRKVQVSLVQGRKMGNCKNWDDDPEQQLFYFGARRWVKRHAPHISFGIETDDAGFSQPSEHVIERMPEPRLEQPQSIVQSSLLRGYMHELDRCKTVEELKEMRAHMDQDDKLTDDERIRIQKHGREVYERIEMLKPKTQEA